MTEMSASVLWDGPGKSGRGRISSQSGALLDYPFSAASRQGHEHPGSGPEELLGAAHAACFTLVFALACDQAGWALVTADTRALVRLSEHGAGSVIDRITLELDATVPGLGEAQFQQLGQAALRKCPLSQALAGVAEVTLVATLNRPGANPPLTD